MRRTPKDFASVADCLLHCFSWLTVVSLCIVRLDAPSKPTFFAALRARFSFLRSSSLYGDAATGFDIQGNDAEADAGDAVDLSEWRGAQGWRDRCNERDC